MIKNLLFICLTFFKLYFFAQNFTATYSFADVTSSTGTIDPTVPPVVPGLTFGSFLANGASANPSAAGRFSFTHWPLGAVDGTDDYSNFTGVLSPTVYFEVSINVDPTYTLSLSSMTFAVRRSGTGVRHYCVRSSLDGYTNNLAVNTGTNPKLSVIPSDVFFFNFDSVSTSSDLKGSTANFGSQFAALSNPVTFRIFAWNAESAGGSFSLDNVSFFGSATNTLTVPNPVGLAPQVVDNPEIRIYPNPCYTHIVIENSNVLSRVEVYSLTGKMLLARQNGWLENSMQLDLLELGKGVYFLKCFSGSQASLKRVILLGN